MQPDSPDLAIGYALTKKLSMHHELQRPDHQIGCHIGECLSNMHHNIVQIFKYFFLICLGYMTDRFWILLQYMLLSKCLFIEIGAFKQVQYYIMWTYYVHDDIEK